MMSDETKRKCPECEHVMAKQIGCGYFATKGFKPSLSDHRESEHTKKVTDKDRAIKNRKRAFGHDAVGDPSDKPDPKHIVKRGRVLGGQEKEVDKREFIKAAAKNPQMVEVAKRALNRS